MLASGGSRLEARRRAGPQARRRLGPALEHSRRKRRGALWGRGAAGRAALVGTAARGAAAKRLERELNLAPDHPAVHAGDEAGQALAALGRVAAAVDAEVRLP